MPVHDVVLVQAVAKRMTWYSCEWLARTALCVRAFRDETAYGPFTHKFCGTSSVSLYNMLQSLYKYRSGGGERPSLSQHTTLFPGPRSYDALGMLVCPAVTLGPAAEQADDSEPSENGKAHSQKLCLWTCVFPVDVWRGGVVQGLCMTWYSCKPWLSA